MNPLDRIDWNLILALHALLTDRSVSAAARRLGVSQPAASKALARLRRQFDDELLVRQGNAYTLTPLAQQLVPLVTEAVSATRSVLRITQTFDPATTAREFVVWTTEYAQIAFGAALVDRFTEEAPGARLVFRGMSMSGGSSMDDLASVDGWLGPRDVFTDVPSSGLHTDRWVCVASEDNDDVRDQLTLEDVASHSWILPTVPKHRELPWVKRLLAHGIDLNIAVTTESFVAVPHLVVGTRHLGVVQELVALRTSTAQPIRVIECPWPMAPLNLTLWWHERRHPEPGHAWFRALVAEVMNGQQPKPQVRRSD
jgi:DNA-binding transcriptional LysR family regulator